MTNQLLLPCFFSGWGDFCLRSSKSPALITSTERVIHFKTLIQFYQQYFFPFFLSIFFFGYKTRRVRQRICPKAASVESQLGREQGLCQAGNSKGEKIRASSAGLASQVSPLNHCFATNHNQKDSYSKSQRSTTQSQEMKNMGL